MIITQQGDVSLFQTNDGGEITVENGIVQMSGCFVTAAYLSLFGGNEDDDGSSKNANNWWGNLDENDSSLQYRSETQNLLQALTATTGNLQRIEDAVNRDLAWFIDKKIASSITVLVTMPAINTIDINVSIVADGVESSFNFTENWKACLNESNQIVASDVGVVSENIPPVPPPPVDYHGAIIADGASHYWRLGESSGIIAVDEISGLDGTYTNTPTLSEPSLLALDPNTSVLFTKANSEYVDVGSSVDLALQSSPWSVEFIFKPTTVSTIEGLIQLKSDWSDPVEITYSNVAALFGVNFGSNSVMSSVRTDTTIVAGLKYHVVITYNGLGIGSINNFNIYINTIDYSISGGAVASNANKDTRFAVVNDLPSVYGDTVIDEISYFPLELTKVQAFNHYDLYANNSGVYRDLILSYSSLVGYWRLGEDGGLIAFDASPTVNNGVYDLGVTLGEPGLIVNSVNTSVDLNASPSIGRITVPHDVAYDLATNFSIEFWVKRDGTQTNRYLFETSSNKHAVIYGFVANSLEFFSVGYTGSNPRTGTTILMNDDIKHHVVFTYDGVTQKGYLDAVEKFSIAKVFSINVPVGILTLGGNSAGSVFSGWLDESAFYNAALTGPEVLNNYNVGMGI